MSKTVAVLCNLCGRSCLTKNQKKWLYKIYTTAEPIGELAIAYRLLLNATITKKMEKLLETLGYLRIILDA